jgi:hypothetical protein
MVITKIGVAVGFHSVASICGVGFAFEEFRHSSKFNR